MKFAKRGLKPLWHLPHMAARPWGEKADCGLSGLSILWEEWQSAQPATRAGYPTFETLP
jgi:hypothetical protein